MIMSRISHLPLLRVDTHEDDEAAYNAERANEQAIEEPGVWGYKS